MRRHRLGLGRPVTGDVSRAGDQHAAHLAEEPHPQIAGRERADPDRRVPPCHRRVGRRVVELELEDHVPVPLRERAQDRRTDERRERPWEGDPHRPFERSEVTAHARERASQNAHRALALGAQGLAGVRERHARRVPQEQARAEARFEVREPPADRRLGQAEVLRRLVHAAVRSDEQEEIEVVEHAPQSLAAGHDGCSALTRGCSKNAP